MNAMKNGWLAAALVGLASAGMAQDAAPSKQEVKLPHVEDLELYTYRLDNRDREFVNAIDLLFGGNILVRTNGPKEVDRIEHFITVGNTLLIRDVPENIEKIVRHLDMLTQTLQEDRMVKAAADKSKEQLVRLEYSPRFSMSSKLVDSLESARRVIDIKRVPNMPDKPMFNISRLPLQGTIVIRDTPEASAEILARLKKLDVPVPEVTVTIMVIAGRDEGETSAGLPKELVDNLSKMVPIHAFELLSTGVVRGKVNESMELSASSTGKVRYNLDMRPSAFDAKARELSLDSVTFLIQTPQYDGGDFKGYDEQSIATSASLRDGEYTALGAVGSAPIFIVLRMTVATR